MDQWTRSDLLDDIRDTFQTQESAGDRMPRIISRSMRSEYQKFGDRHKWHYFQRVYEFTTPVPYSTGTVVYTHTGGTYERQLVLTSGVFPAWSVGAVVDIGNTLYRVEQRISDTVCTLLESQNPGSNVSSSSYLMFQTDYAIPNDVHRIANLVNISSSMELSYISPSSVPPTQRYLRSTGLPIYYSLRGSDSVPNQMIVEIWPPSSTAYTYRASYEGRPRPFTITDMDAFTKGTVSVSGTTATISAGRLPANIAGCLFRYSPNTESPTGVSGENPYFEQIRIRRRLSDTTFELYQSPAMSVSGLAYLIDDPIDIEPTAMLVSFRRFVEEEVFRLLMQNDRLQVAIDNSRRAFLEAMAADSRISEPGRRFGGPWSSSLSLPFLAQTGTVPHVLP